MNREKKRGPLVPLLFIKKILVLLNRHPYNLVCGFNPFEKYAGQIGSFFQVRVKIKNI